MNKLALTLIALLAGLTIDTAATSAPPAIPDDLEKFIRGLRLPIEHPAPAPELPDVTIDAGRGPIPVHVPPSYDPDEPTPVIMLLHGFTNTGPQIESWLQFTPLSDEFGFLLLYPTGTSDIFGNRFWNATDACCNLFGSNVNDSAYLRAVIEEMIAQFNVDPRRIHLVGHSNGGFMSYRMACDHADVVASIASLAGATWLNPASCAPSEPVHVLQIHGTSDTVIAYNGGCVPFGGCYPSAPATVSQWATYDGCSLVPDQSAPPLDLVANIAGAETTVTRYDQQCAPGGSAELWTMNGGPHSPVISTQFSRLVVEFLYAHPKPALCPADLDGSGDVGFADILAIIGAWGPCAGACPQDLNGNGSVDFADILAAIAAWGSCA